MGYSHGHYDVALNEPSTTFNAEMYLEKCGTDRNALVGVYSRMYLEDSVFKRPVFPPYKPHLSDAGNYLSSAVHRFACKMPVPDPVEQSKFLTFAKAFIQAAFTPLRDEEVPEWKEWLEKTNYPGARKAYFVDLLSKLREMSNRTVEVESFIKDECYLEPKNARSINSVSDEYKVLLGPLFKAVDKKTFKERYFVKGKNPREWPDLLEKLFKDEPVVGTDSSSFEAVYQRGYELVLYYWAMHMTRDLTRVRPLRDLIARLMLGNNEIKFKGMRCVIDNRLMSGVLWTSSGNAIMNLVQCIFLAARARGITDTEEMVKFGISDFVGLVEGDDGICLDVGQSDELAAKLGFRLKWDRARNYTECGFCHIICDRESKAVLKEPIEVLRKFFVLPKEYANSKDSVHKGLLRARAMSYAVSYPQCPIIGPLARAVLNATEGVDETKYVGKLTWFQQETWQKRKDAWKPVEIPYQAREIVARVYKVSIDEQLRIEAVVSNMKFEATPINLERFMRVNDVNHSLNFLTTQPALWTSPPRSHVKPIIAEALRTGKLVGPEPRAARAERITRRWRHEPPTIDWHTYPA